jgi:hypothetical protein
MRGQGNHGSGPPNKGLAVGTEDFLSGFDYNSSTDEIVLGRKSSKEDNDNRTGTHMNGLWFGPSFTSVSQSRNGFHPTGNELSKRVLYHGRSEPQAVKSRIN